ncbi:DNA-3-methyladenine glycosylase family protein [Alcanivorax sp. IL2]|uniref:DNA-3-methyladenine glycosylase family protein n=1 Tax=Alcanivorax sp. IL2 TaxID=3396310 RepID=UPI0039C1654F
MRKKTAELTLTLPADFNREAFLDFHRRDTEAVAEKVDAGALEKAFIWQQVPTLLTVEFDQPGHARVTLHCDDKPPSASASLDAFAGHLLGLDQPTQAFEAQAGRHSLVGAMVRSQAGLRVPQSASPFEALSWAIIGQQISVVAAVSIRRRFIQRLGRRHSNGLYCYPDASDVASTNVEALKACGFSRSKAECLLTVARRCLDEALLPEIHMAQPDLETLRKSLLAIRGLGPWSVHYALLRGYAWMDGSLHGDVAVRRAIQQLLGNATAPSTSEAERWLAEFRPWRSLMAAHLWKSLSVNA